MEFLRGNLAIIKAGVELFGATFFNDNGRGRLDELGVEFAEMDSHQINIKAGVIKAKDELSLKRTLFRISRNNCFVMFAPYQVIPDKMEK